MICQNRQRPSNGVHTPCGISGEIKWGRTTSEQLTYRNSISHLFLDRIPHRNDKGPGLLRRCRYLPVRGLKSEVDPTIESWKNSAAILNSRHHMSRSHGLWHAEVAVNAFCPPIRQSSMTLALAVSAPPCCSRMENRRMSRGMRPSNKLHTYSNE